MILFYAKPLNKDRENTKTTWKNFEKTKKYLNWCKEKTQICFVGIKILSNSQNTAIFHNRSRACNFIKKRLQNRYFSVKFPKILRMPFLPVSASNMEQKEKEKQKNVNKQ